MKVAPPRVELPRAAVTEPPAEYGTAVIENTPSVPSTVTTTDELVNTWQAS